MKLSAEDVVSLRTGARFVACAVDPTWSGDEQQRILTHMQDEGASPDLLDADEIEDGSLVVAVGYVNRGASTTELRPVGDEFCKSIDMLQRYFGEDVRGVYSLAGAAINALSPFMVGMQLGLPVVDADAEGRVYPLVFQSVFTLGQLPAGPLAVAGPVGEASLVDVRDPRRAEPLIRALATEFGGWAATAMYPLRIEELRKHAIRGSLSRLIGVGKALESNLTTKAKHRELMRSFDVRLILRARVRQVIGLSYAPTLGQPDLPTSIILEERTQGRLIQLEFQNEFLLLLVDGAVRAQIPDVITLLHPEDGTVAGLADLWEGNLLDIFVLAADPQWYTPQGLRLARTATQDLMN